MTQADSPKITVKCPRCARPLLVDAKLAGRKVKCPGCSQVLVPAARKQPAEEAAASEGNCMICQTPLSPGEPRHQCPGCAGLAHPDCWQYNRGCGVYGCQEAPPTEGLDTLEIPPSHWGQENKNCPSCKQVIKAAAVRCKHCGATFEVSAPESEDDFHAREDTKANLPAVKAIAVVMLVFGLLPCTAPIVAVASPVWYFKYRQTIALLPGFHSALCKIAVGASIAITLLLVLFTIMNLVQGIEHR